MCTDISRMDVELRNIDDGKSRILPSVDPDTTILSDPPSNSPRDSPKSLDDEKIEMVPPAELEVTMLLDPPSVSPRESQFQEVLVEQPLLKLNIENMFVASPRHSGVDDINSVL